MKKEVMCLLFILAFFLTLGFGFLSADFELANYSIDKNYAPNETIRGWVNLSVSNEPTNSLFETSFDGDLGGNISLIELLKKNTAPYTCNPLDCNPGYSEADSEQTKKSFNLNSGNSGVFGFKLTGTNFNRVSNFSINISSNVGESVSPQLYIDVLNDGFIEWSSYKGSGNFGTKEYGCYSSSDVEDPPANIVTESKYCEKISFSGDAPNANIGANVVKISGGSVNFELSIENPVTGDSGSCSKTAFVSEEIKCVAKDSTGKDFKIKQRDYHICIKKKSDSGEYGINYETSTPCGFSGTFSESEGYYVDFDIFAEPGKFAPIGSFRLNDVEIESSGIYGFDIEGNITSYISQKYNNDCSSGCIIPIKFISKQSQQINVSDISIYYAWGGGGGITTKTDKIYNVTETLATVRTNGFRKLSLDNAKFFVPWDFGDYDFLMSLNRDEIFSEEITIEKIPQIISLSPKIVPAAYPTKFQIEIETFDSENDSISGYEWDFFTNGSDVKTTLNNTVTYTYKSLGVYQLKVTLRTSKGLSSSKTFNITVETPKQAVNILLEKKLENLKKIKSQIETLSSFHQTSLNSILDLTKIESGLGELQKKNASASSDQDYINIMTELVSLDVPEGIVQTEVANSISFYPVKENINLEVLKEIGGGDYLKSEEKYIDAILAWNLEKTNAKIDYIEYSTIYENATKGILRIFELKVNENPSREDSYLIIPKLSNLRFKEDYSEKEVGNYVYIELTSGGKTVVFSTKEDVSFVDLPAFISPNINKLSIVTPETKEKQFKITLFVLILLLLILMGTAAYIILAKWYDKKYEDYLFKNKNDLYNIVTYVHSAKKQGMKNREIEKNLRKSKWNLEQIRYVMRKYAGKRTGMLNVSFGKIFGGLKKEKPKKIGDMHLRKPNNMGKLLKFRNIR